MGLSALSVDTLVKDWNLRTVAGRQTLNTDGVLGRFDGAVFSWKPLPMLRVDLVGGSPTLSRCIRQHRLRRPLSAAQRSDFLGIAGRRVKGFIESGRLAGYAVDYPYSARSCRGRRPLQARERYAIGEASNIHSAD
jgi:hypothetical protein